MRTLVYQSHAPRVPVWIRQCTASVSHWAEANGFSYRLLGEELFADIPVQISVKAQSLLPMTDLGRLLWAERLLESWDRVIWVDADVLVFDPPRFVLDLGAPFLVCREILTETRKGGPPFPLIGHNPTVLMFQPDGDAFLKRWIGEIERVAKQAKGFGDADFGRNILSRIGPKGDRNTIRTVGHFNAAILKEIYGAPGPAIETMMRASGNPFAAANLCGHYPLSSKVYSAIVDKLAQSRGAVVNACLAA
jgi:hypothetical protein